MAGLQKSEGSLKEAEYEFSLTDQMEVAFHLPREPAECRGPRVDGRPTFGV
jgi:hypothetical protein